MNRTPSSLWGILLAGGEGMRLRAFVRERVGIDIPKQFCAFVGARTLLERTVRRAELLIDSRHLVVSGTAHHRFLLSRSLGHRPPNTVLLQPRNRDTAPGILFPLIHILQSDPDALVALFPSDHFVLPGRRLMQAVSLAADHLRRTQSDYPVMIAVEATYPETEYGWIAPGPPVVLDRTESIFRATGFVETPDIQVAEHLLADGWLWNTMVFVVRGASLLELFQRAVPDVAASFKILQRYVGGQHEQVFTEEIYRLIPSLNFSTAVLPYQADRLLVLPIRGLQWSDWGNKERILQSLASLRNAKRAGSVPVNNPGFSVIAPGPDR